jgi:hypothetical protein
MNQTTETWKRIEEEFQKRFKKLIGCYPNIERDKELWGEATHFGIELERERSAKLVEALEWYASTLEKCEQSTVFHAGMNKLVFTALPTGEIAKQALEEYKRGDCSDNPNSI